MDISSLKTQREMGRSSKTPSGSMGSAEKGRKKTRAPETQSAGQPSGTSLQPSVESTRSKRSALVSESARSRRTVESEDGESVTGAGAGTKVAWCIVGVLHAIDIGLGVSLVVYGGLVHATAVTAAAISYGLVLLLGALLGAIGYFSACGRRGLRAGAIAGFLICIMDIGTFVAILVSWDSFIGFLNENYEHLMLSEDSVEMIEGLKIPLAVIFVVLACLEVLRGFVMWGMKDILPEQAVCVTPLSRSTSVSKPNWFLALLGLAKRKKTDDFVMFDDNASMESSLLWSHNRAQPTSDDYLEFIPDHERGLSIFSNVLLPKPPEETMDY